MLLNVVAEIFANQEVVTKGFLADYMFQQSPFRADALKGYMKQLLTPSSDNSTETLLDVQRNESYVRESGWYFKTLAVQEIGEYEVELTSQEIKLLHVSSSILITISGENVILRASYRRVYKNVHTFTSLLPFFGTDYGLCTLIKPQITFDPKLAKVPFSTLMTNYTKSIKPGIQLGKENGLSILLDAEVSFKSCCLKDFPCASV